jgi:hypothetical protein
MNESEKANSPSDVSDTSFIRLAEAHRREGLVENAIRICREGLAKFPSSLRGRIILGQSLLDQGAIGEAIVELGRVERESGGDPEILALLCDVRMAGPQRRPATTDIAADSSVSLAAHGGESGSEERVEPPVLMLDSAGQPASDGALAGFLQADPLASPTLAGLYASQGDPAMAETILRQITPEETPPDEEASLRMEPGSATYLMELTRLRQGAERLRRSQER